MLITTELLKNKQKFNIAMVGTGYVGLVVAACLAEIGNNVICVDHDLNKIKELNKHQVSFYEPGLKKLIIENHTCKRLQFTNDLEYGINNSELIFIALGTSLLKNGAPVLTELLTLIHDIVNYVTQDRIIILKSTIPVGTTNKIAKIIATILSERCLTKLNIYIAHNPEFLSEGTAISNFINAPRIIIGTNDPEVKKIMATLYAPFIKDPSKLLFMEPSAAEFSKYAANAMLATKISFINEIANIASNLHINIKDICKVIGLDPRIGEHYLEPGCGYGGSCLGKDLQTLIQTSNKNNYFPKLLNAVSQVNSEQQQVLFNKIKIYFKTALSGKIIAIWGLAFKPDTSDIRESPSCILIEKLWEYGVLVQAFDPQAMPAVAQYYGVRHDLLLVANKETCLYNADALVICTQWQEFIDADLDVIANLLINKVIFDGRNIFNYEVVKKRGISYYGIGTGDVIAAKF